ncbi:50S ribosomal protein L10 [bacterium]|nr:50S ribosomal protein L10 [bacterium]|tara:strand:- start:434 stop:949 length:516 start_codon:yes stop_codon:yes gene_type:complete
MLKKSQKESIVSVYSEAINSSPSFILINFSGSKVLEFEKLRKAFRKLDTKVSVVKNSLLKKATLDTDFEKYFSELRGETAIALLNDNYVEAAKSFMDIKKESPAFEIKFGYIDGNVITLNQLEAISKLPSREILISQFLSVINQPAVKFLYVAKSIPSSLINVLNNLKDKK